MSLDPIVKQIERILTPSLRKRAGYGKYSRTLVYASPLRIAYILIIWKEIVDMSTESMLTWSSDDKNGDMPLKPNGIIVTDAQRKLMSCVSGDHWSGDYEAEEDTDSEEIADELKIIVSKMEKVHQHVHWLMEYINCESALFGAMWCSEMLSNYGGGRSNDLGAWNPRSWELMCQITRFYRGLPACYRLGGLFYSFSDQQLLPMNN